VTRLIPARYPCRKHDHDLTDEVLAKVDGDAMFVANLNWQRTASGMVRTGAFEVDVRCPGGDDGGHGIRFMGSFEK
jgi:hypothetical protein